MTTPTAAHADPHASGHGAEHHPHVLPLSTYFAIYFTLLVLTALTVAVSYVDLGNANLFIALAIATAKALCVALVFMHLLFDKKFNSIVFSSAIIFLAIFIGFTMSDTDARGLSGRTSSDGPVDIQNPFGPTRSQAAVERMYSKTPWKPQKPAEMDLDPKANINLQADTPTPSGASTSVDVPVYPEGETPKAAEKNEKSEKKE